MKDKPFEIVYELEKESAPETHAMAVYGNTLFVIDGKKLLKKELPVETIWQKMWKLIRFFEK